MRRKEEGKVKKKGAARIERREAWSVFRVFSWTVTRGSSQLWERQQWEFWRRREISRLKGIGLSEPTSVVSIPKYRLFPFVPVFLFLLRSYPIEETILLLFRPRDLDISLRRPESMPSFPFPSFPPPLPPHRTATSRAFSLRYSIELFDKRDVERDQLSPSLPPPFLTTIPCLRSRYSTGTNSFDDLSNCGNHNPDYKLDFTRNILPLLLPLISIYHRHPPKRRSNVVSDSWANVIKSSPRHGGTA